MSEWSKVRFEKFTDFNPRESIVKGEVAVKVGMDMLQPFCRDVSGIEYEKYYGGAKFRNGDTIMARITPCLENGKTAMVNVLEEGKVGFGSTEYIVLRAKKGMADPYFLYYLVCSPVVRDPAIKTMVGTSGRQRVQVDMVRNLELKIPSLPEQKKIGSILRKLDDKIENNTRINRNLTEQLKLLYSEYFEREKAEEWPKVPLSDLILFQEGPGIRNWQYVAENGTKFINIRCINNDDIDVSTANMISYEEAEGKYAHFLLKPYDIVMSCSGTLGRYAIVREEHLPLCLNTSVIRFSPAVEQTDFSYVYGYITSKEFLNRQREMASGSVQANFGPTHLKEMWINDPPIALRKEYHEFVFPIIEQMICLRRENNKLIYTRDSLLPKLMSGELDISELDI